MLQVGFDSPTTGLVTLLSAAKALKKALGNRYNLVTLLSAAKALK